MIVSATPLRTAVTLVSTQTDEVTIRPADDGWHIHALSPDHVTLMKVDLPLAAFRGYVAWEPFAVKVDDIIQSLSTATDVADIDISSGRLVVKANGLRYRKALLVPDETAPRTPQLDVTTEVVTTVDRLMQVVNKGDQKFGQVRFTVSPESFVATVEDEQGLGVSLEIPVEECELLIGEATAWYPLKAWLPFLKALPKGASLDMQFDTNFPLMATYTSPELTFMWMVAPHLIEEE